MLKKIKIQVLSVIGGNLAATISGVFRNIALARYLTPAEFGQLNLISVIINYLNYLDFGANNGALYLAIKAKYNGDTNKAIDILGQFQLLVCWLALGSASLVFLISTFCATGKLLNMSTGIALSAAVIINSMNNYLIIELRIFEKFLALSFVSAISSIVGVVILILWLLYGINSRIEIIALVNLAGTIISIAIFMLINKKIMMARTINQRLIVSLIKTGAPVTVVPLIYVLYQSVDRWILSINSNQTEFGYYAFGATLGAMLAILPNSISTIVINKFIKAKENNYEIEPFNLLIYSISISAVSLAYICGILLIALPQLIALLFPKYESGVELIRIMVVAAGCLFPVNITTSYLLGRHNIRSPLIGSLFFVVLMAVLVFFANKWYGIYSVGYIVIICNLCYSKYLMHMAGIGSKSSSAISWIKQQILFLPVILTFIMLFIVKSSSIKIFGHNKIINSSLLLAVPYSFAIYFTYSMIKKIHLSKI